MVLEETDRIKLKAHLLYIMDCIHELCVRNGIRYSLFYGSLIGAVMYKGFIPWDDDIDIVMMRKDYNKFFEVCKTQLPDNLFIQSIETETNFKVPGITKIRLNNTLLVEYADCKEKIHHGVWVDLTVIENIDDSLLTLKKTKYYFKLFRDKYYYRSSFIHYSFKGFIYNTFRRLLPPFSIKNTGKKFIKYSRYCIDENTKYVFQPFSYQDDVYKREWLEDYDLYEFEGRHYLGFKKYDEILKVRFPTYNIIPSEDSRKTNHEFCKVRL